MSPGLMLFLLADCADGLAEALGGMDRINSSAHKPDATTSPLAYYITEQLKKPKQSVRVRVWCASAHAPDPTRRYSSAAWGVDASVALGWYDRPRWHSMLPAAGIAATLTFNGLATPLKEIGHITTADAAIDGDLLTLLGTKNGPVVTMSPPFQRARTLRHDASIKAAFSALALDGDALWIGDKNGWLRCIDRASGAEVVGRAAPALASTRRAATEAHTAAARYTIDAAGELRASTHTGELLWQAQTGVKRATALSVAPDGVSFVIATRSSLEIWHEPSAQLALSLYGDGLPHWTADGRWLLCVGKYSLALWRVGG
jgi:hypothetical protein